MEHFFCAAASRRNGESLYGTVARIRSWLLLEYPNAWRAHAIEDSRLLTEENQRHLCQDFDRALLIRREHVRTGPLHCYRIDGDGVRLALLDRYEEVGPQLQFQQTAPELMYAVCTHGKHDKCCAKFGLPVFCAFRDVVGARAWQCSHVGGDRFAANVVVFPQGLYYGHIQPDEAGELVRRAERGEVWLERYRGRASFPRAGQIAEYFVRAESGRMRIDEFEFAGAQRRDGITEVRFTSPSDQSEHVVEFATEPAALREFLTCGSTELCDVPQYRLVRYRVSPTTVRLPPGSPSGIRD